MKTHNEYTTGITVTDIEYDVDGRQLAFKFGNDWGSRIMAAVNPQ